MEKIGIFGGSFDPPHIGHILAAQAAKKELGLDRLLLIPAAATPQKQGHYATAAQRLEMLRLACRTAPELEISELELRRGGVSYTCETVQQLRSENPAAQLFLLMGSDQFAGFAQWRDADKILKNVTLAVFGRGKKGEEEAIRSVAGQLCNDGHALKILPLQTADISSTQLRRMLVFDCAEAFLSPAVADYIRDNRLYGTGRDYKNLPEAELEQVVVSLLKPQRVAHVLGCRDTAVALAKRWSENETEAARAALLHDVTKALDGQLQLCLCRSYGRELDAFSLHYPKTLHALTGAMVAKRIFGENDRIVNAIESHTTGKANMNMLQMILYVADYMEPNRDFPGVEQLRALANEDMQKALRLGLEMTAQHLNEQGEAMSPASKEALQYLYDKMK